MKSPPAFAFELLLVTLTVPPCGHIMTLEVFSSAAMLANQPFKFPLRF